MSIKKLARKLWTGRSSREVAIPVPATAAVRGAGASLPDVGRTGAAASAAGWRAGARDHAGPAGRPARRPRPARRARIPWSSAPPSRSRACWANRFRWISTPRPTPRARATPRPGCRAAAGQPAPLTAIEGYTTQSERTPVRQIIFVDPSIDNAEQMVQGLYSLVSGKTEGLGGLARPTGEARSCRCCAAMTPDHRAGRPL